MLAQGGRPITAYDIPRDLYPDSNYDSVIYYLGANDMYAETPTWVVMRTFADHIRKLLGAKFKLTVLIPAILPTKREASIALREEMLKRCASWKLYCIDLEEIWDIEWTTDTIHPSLRGHEILADYIDGLRAR